MEKIDLTEIRGKYHYSNFHSNGFKINDGDDTEYSLLIIARKINEIINFLNQKNKKNETNETKPVKTKRAKSSSYGD